MEIEKFNPEESQEQMKNSEKVKEQTQKSKYDVSSETDKEAKELYNLKDGELSFEAEPEDKDLILEICKELDINTRIVESKMAQPSIAVIIEGNYKDRATVMEKIEEMLINQEKEK
jgi:hypothetical protein